MLFSGEKSLINCYFVKLLFEMFIANDACWGNYLVYIIKYLKMVYKLSA